MQKKLSVLCTTFLLPLLMTVLAFAADSPFSDVAPDAPYAESIAYLVEHGITNGTGADTFSPDAPVTVRQWSVMLCRAYGLTIEGDTWEEMSYVALSHRLCIAVLFISSIARLIAVFGMLLQIRGFIAADGIVASAAGHAVVKILFTAEVGAPLGKKLCVSQLHLLPDLLALRLRIVQGDFRQNFLFAGFGI